MNLVRTSTKLVIVVNVYFVLVTVILMFLYDGYQFTRQFLSALGGNDIGWIFNSGVILLGLSSLVFYIAIPSIYPVINKFLKFLFLSLGITSSISLLGIGAFVSGGPLSETHDFFAILYFVILIPLTLVFAFIMKVSNSGNVLIVLALITSVITFVGLFVPGVNQFIFQKLIVYSYSAFLVKLGFEALTKKS